MTADPGGREDVPPPPGRVRAPQDLAAGLALVAVALLTFWAGADLETGRLRAMGPGMLPRVLAGLLGLAGLGLAAGSLLHRGEPLGRWPLRGPLFVVLAVISFGYTIRQPGLAVAGPLVVLVSGAASPDTRPRELVIFAVVVTAFCIGLFRYLLRLPIPILNVPGFVVI